MPLWEKKSYCMIHSFTGEWKSECHGWIFGFGDASSSCLSVFNSKGFNAGQAILTLVIISLISICHTPPLRIDQDRSGQTLILDPDGCFKSYVYVSERRSTMDTSPCSPTEYRGNRRNQLFDCYNTPRCEHPQSVMSR